MFLFCIGTRPAERLTISCDNIVDAVYADGQQMALNSGVATNWRKVDYINLPAGASTLAVKCSDHGVIPGVMASTSGGVVTEGASGRYVHYNLTYLNQISCLTNYI